MKKGSSERGIVGAASVVSSATVLSRIFGYLRDMAIAFYFGAGAYSDAFFVAFRISNLLRRLVGEGALTASFIPIFTDEKAKRGEEESRAIVSSVFTLFLMILLIASALGMVFSPGLVTLMSPGFMADPEKFSITVGLTRLMFPYMIFIGLMAIGMGVLNSLKHFAAPAFAPILFNIAIIGSILFIAPHLGRPVWSLAIGVLIGGFLQFAVLLPFLWKYGFLPRLSFNFTDRAIKRIFKLMGPAAFGAGIYQLNIFVVLWFASRLPEGSVSYLYYAGRLMELPLGVFGVAISTAVLPSLSEHAAEDDSESFNASLNFALRLVLFVTVPSMVGLFVLSLPIIEVLFTHGRFGTEEARATATALYYYAPGVVSVALYRILTSVFYSLKDTATPVIVAFMSFLINILMCAILVGPLAHGGLALAATISSIFNMIALFSIFKARRGVIGARTVLSSALRNALAALAMGGFLYLIMTLADYSTLSLGEKTVFLAAGVLAGSALYLGLSKVQKSPEMAYLGDFVRRGGRALGSQMKKGPGGHKFP